MANTLTVEHTITLRTTVLIDKAPPRIQPLLTSIPHKILGEIMSEAYQISAVKSGALDLLNKDFQWAMVEIPTLTKGEAK